MKFDHFGSLESSYHSLLFIDDFIDFLYHLIIQFKDLDENLYFDDFLFIDFGKITVNQILILKTQF